MTKRLKMKVFLFTIYIVQPSASITDKILLKYCLGRQKFLEKSRGWLWFVHPRLLFYRIGAISFFSKIFSVSSPYDGYIFISLI